MGTMGTSKFVVITGEILAILTQAEGCRGFVEGDYLYL